TCKKFRIGMRLVHVGLITLAAFVTISLWFGYEIIAHGWWFVHEFISYQIRLLTTPDAGHGGSFFYHWIVLLVGCFPASIFLLSYLRGRKKQSIYTGSAALEIKDFIVWMWVLFWVVLILFSIVETKIVHYSSLCYFPLSFLAAWQIYRIAEGKLQLRGWITAIILIIGLVIGLAITLLPVVGVYKSELIPHIGDRFARANLEAQVPWSLWESAYGAVYMLLIIIGAVLLFSRKKQAGILTIFFSTILAIQITIVHFTPKIERFSQGAAIDFFKSFVGKDDYVQVLSYHSYAHLFYTKKLPPANKKYYDKEWLLNGPVDKPTYFICRINNADEWRNHPNLQVIGEKNGFVFFKRK
ncbi:MAG TPA: hypothetical protein VJ720_05060, partial [Chitinophaga sp.]|nr:hypothetical protein [Chitinophaga sp.]